MPNVNEEISVLRPDLKVLQGEEFRKVAMPILGDAELVESLTVFPMYVDKPSGREFVIAAMRTTHGEATTAIGATGVFLIPPVRVRLEDDEFGGVGDDEPALVALALGKVKEPLLKAWRERSR